MDDPVFKRMLTIIASLALLTLLGWQNAPGWSLPGDGELAAGIGITRGAPTGTVPVRLHSLRGVTHHADAPLTSPDLEKPMWKPKANDFADVGNMDAAMFDSEPEYNPPTKNRDGKDGREGHGLNDKSKSSDRFLKESEGSFHRGWLGGSMADADGDAVAIIGARLDPDYLNMSDDDFADPFDGSAMDEGRGSDAASEDGYDNYLYDNMGDSGKAIGFDSLEGFEGYAPKE